MNNLVVKINRTEILNDIEKPLKKEGLERIDVGDTVKLGILIKEGEKERTQFYEGVVIAEKNSGINKTKTVVFFPLIFTAFKTISTGKELPNKEY